MVEDNRTSTDILLELEVKIDLLSRRFNNVELLLKTILNNINKQSSSSVQEESKPIKNTGPINKNNFDQRDKTTRFADLASQHGLDVEDEPPARFENIIKARPSELPPDPGGDDMVEAPSRGASRGQRGAKTSAKLSVSQVLYRDEGQPLFLASVEVLDESGVLINQTRTNPKGRWLMALSPGEYQVHVLKRFTQDSGKETVDVTYKINIPPSDKPMELTPLTLNEADTV